MRIKMVGTLLAAALAAMPGIASATVFTLHYTIGVSRLIQSSAFFLAVLPKPGSWATMTPGPDAAGWSMRRRRTLATA